MRRVLFLCVGLALAGPGLAQTPQRQIAVTGEGRVEAAPDIATISTGVETEAETAAEALARSSEAMAQVLDALLDAGIAPADVQTSQVILEPVWSEPGEDALAAPEIGGYLARNQVSVRVRELARLGAVLDTVTGAGANRLGGIAFGLADPGSRENQARERAVADARARAELYARAAGLTLGPVLEIRDTPDYGGPVPMMRAEAMAMDVPIAEGALEVIRTVEMVFAIEGGD